MKKKLVAMRLAAMMMAAVMVTPSVAVYADEETAEVSEEGAEEGEATEEGQDMENPEGEDSEESSGGSVVMSGLTASNGKEIAASFPDSMVPQGFHKTSVEYSGQSVDVAYMDSDGYGEVVLAYLANSDGSDGDFYLCDINTAQMSDYVRIPNGEGKFIVVLDPGDNVVAPAGFIKATLDWHGKRVTAWALPQEDAGQASIKDLIAPVEVYALDITAGASGDDSSDAASEDEEATEEETKGTKASSQTSPEDGSRVEYASASDFFLIYAIDQDGKVGFYLYDIAGETFQRYVEISGGENALLTQYRKDARTRLIVMIVLAVLLLICIIIIINLVLGSGSGNGNAKRRPRRYDDEDDEDDEDEDEDDDDEDDERRKMIRRVAKKEKSHIRQGRREMNYMMDIDDEDDDEDEDIDDDEDEDEEIEEVRPVRRRRPAEPERRPVRRREEDRPRRQAAPARRIIEDTDDDEDMDDIPVRRTPSRPVSKVTKTAPKKGISIEPDVEDGLDDDFEFEFLDI